MKSRILSLLAAVCFLALFVNSTLAEDFYCVKRLAALRIDEGKLPIQKIRSYGRFRERSNATFPYAVLDGEGEIFVANPADAKGVDVFRDVKRPHGLVVAIRTDKKQIITGRLFVVDPDSNGKTPLRFSILPEDLTEKSEQFHLVKYAHYKHLFDLNLPGGAWFRHQMRVARQAVGGKYKREIRQNDPLFGRDDALENTFSLLSGGRAIAENLQLERLLPEAKADVPKEPLNRIRGITVRNFDWTPLVLGLKPEKDPLAALIPADQYAAFFPSVSALAAVVQSARELAEPAMGVAEQRGEDPQSALFYQRQLCLPLADAARLLGPQAIDSIALTGGDPYFRSGSDVAVLIAAKDAAALRKTIEAQVARFGNKHAQAKAVFGKIDGIPYAGMRSPDRSICCYVATLGNNVVVTNSPAQLKRLVAVHQGRTAALSSLDEYTFFRNRYRRGQSQETALLILSDKTIRRWCGPKWRIASSRRLRAAAVMSDMQAEHLDRLVAGKVKAHRLVSKFPLPDAGEFTLTSSGVQSSVYGNLEFQTPVAELDFTHVTRQEAKFYRTWRDEYQSNWQRFFDPIAVQLTLRKNRLAADLTVMPLIDNSDYRIFIELSQGAKIKPHAGDQHNSLVHCVMSLNKKSVYYVLASLMLRENLKPQDGVDPLGWFGQSVAIYVDDDPYWADLVKAKDPDRFIEDNWHRFPAALHIDVRNKKQFVAFLAKLRAFFEPEDIDWKTLKHNDRTYFKITPVKAAKESRKDNKLDKFSIYYAIGEKSLTITMNENLIKSALDRRQAKEKDKAVAKQKPLWIGDNLCLQIDGKIIQTLEAAYADVVLFNSQAIAWKNLPILNEWRRRYPASDSPNLHQQFWHRRLVDPAGGTYRWNEKWQTYESTLYGHPGQPKKGPTLLPSTLRNIHHGNFGLTFEQHGLRARVELIRKTK